ncbi:MAG: formate dehydrogenase accessory sulfurtransferase FdhD [Thiolinea sp.]
MQPLDEYGQPRDSHISAERPLTVYLDKREIVTLMTMGSQPELLILGWLRNQNLVSELQKSRPSRSTGKPIRWPSPPRAAWTGWMKNWDARPSPPAAARAPCSAT